MTAPRRRTTLLALALAALAPLAGCAVYGDGGGYGYGGGYYDTFGGGYGDFGPGYRVGPFHDFDRGGFGHGFHGGRGIPSIPGGGRGGFHGGGGGFHGGGGGFHGGGGGHGR